MKIYAIQIPSEDQEDLCFEEDLENGVLYPDIAISGNRDFYERGSEDILNLVHEAEDEYCTQGDGIAAYLRVLPQGVAHEAAAIGRVISVKRRMGLGTKIVEAGIAVAKEKFHADCIEIGAQTYVRKLYENVGFVQSGPEYVEDGIPHIPMILKLDP